MTTDHPRAASAPGLARHVSPEQVRAASFERAAFGRRGFDEVEVQEFLDQMADELAMRDAEIARLATENCQLKHALREWHRQLVGYDAAELIARTQQHIEAQIAQAEAYSREREEEATQRYDEIIAEARRRALAETQQLVHESAGGGEAGHGGHRGRRGRDDGADDHEGWLARQQVYAHALLQALDALAAHVHATRQAFTFEVSRLGDIGDIGDGRDPAAGPGAVAGASVPVAPGLAATAYAAVEGIGAVEGVEGAGAVDGTNASVRHDGDFETADQRLDLDPDLDPDENLADGSDLDDG